MRLIPVTTLFVFLTALSVHAGTTASFSLRCAGLLVEQDTDLLLLSHRGNSYMIDGSKDQTHDNFFLAFETGFIASSQMAASMVFDNNHENFVGMLNRIDSVLGSDIITEQQRAQRDSLISELALIPNELKAKQLDKAKIIKAANSKLSMEQARKEARQQLLRDPEYLARELDMLRKRESLLEMYAPTLDRLQIPLSLLPSQFNKALERIDPYLSTSSVEKKDFRRGEVLQAEWPILLSKKKWWSVHENDPFNPPIKTLTEYEARSTAFANSDDPNILSRTERLSGRTVKYDPRTSEYLVVINGGKTILSYFILVPASDKYPRGYRTPTAMDYFFQDLASRSGFDNH